MNSLRAMLSIVLAAPLAACTAGPDFVRPDPPKTQSYTAENTRSRQTPEAGPTAPPAAQRMALGQQVAARWWELFRSTPLNEVLTRALSANQTLAAARANLAAAQEAVDQARGALFPQIDANANVTREKLGSGRFAGLQSSTSGRKASSVTNLYSIGPNVSYALDFFGANRRKVEQQQALADAANYELASAYLTLTGNAVVQAVTIASVRAQLEALQDIIAIDERTVALATLKMQAGKAAQTEVLAAQSQWANDRAQLAPLRQQLSAAKHALSVLAGAAPSQWAPPDFALAEMTLPMDLPLSIPSELARRRPDILAAEANLHAASAAIGVATAQLYPSLNITAAFSQDSSGTGILFTQAGSAWSAAAALTAPLFHGGSLEAERRAAIAKFEASFAIYRQTVLEALGQVADILMALDHDRQLLEAETRAAETAQASVSLSQLSYGAGKSSLIDLLDAQRQYQQARLGQVRATAQRLQDTTQLFAAMGGGWWEWPETAAP